MKSGAVGPGASGIRARGGRSSTSSTGMVSPSDDDGLHLTGHGVEESNGLLAHNLLLRRSQKVLCVLPGGKLRCVARTVPTIGHSVISATG